MRLWTLHPRYLDPRGLVALWREALLAQAVLKGETHGYTHHPQLDRFRDAPAPLDSIGAYLNAVHTEAVRRGYRFDHTKIAASNRGQLIVATQGQLDYERDHLKTKLLTRAPAWIEALVAPGELAAHPLFRIVAGPVADWEVV